MMNISNILFDTAKKYPDKTAIFYKKKQISYRNLLVSVNQTVAGLIKKGIKPGDKILIFVPMSIDLYRILLAVFQIGATAVFLDEWVSMKRLNLCCKIADCDAIFCIPKVRILSFFSKQLRKIPIKFGLRYSKKESLNFCYDVKYETSALITFTTGSSGLPKAANRTHGFLNEQYLALLEKINPKPTDVCVTSLPIVLLINLAVGATSIISDINLRKPEKFKPSNFIKELTEQHINQIIMSPYFINKISKVLIKQNISNYSVKKIFTGGAPVFPSDAKIMQSTFCHANIEIIYGSTEAEPISSINAKKLETKNMIRDNGLSVGTIFHKTQLYIIPIIDKAIKLSFKQSIKDISLPDGTVGEIVVAGPHVLKKYYSNDEAFARNKIIDNDIIWHRTGDAGFIKNNELFLCGTTKSVILKQEKVIAPFIIENYLKTIEGIENGTIIKINEILLLVIQLDNKKAKEKTKIQLQKTDIEFDKITFVEKIPLDPRHNSKIDYDSLKVFLVN